MNRRPVTPEDSVVWTMVPLNTARSYRWLPVLVSVIILIAAAIGGIALTVVQDRLLRAQGETLTLAAADIADIMDLFLRERGGDVLILARASAIPLSTRDTQALSANLAAVREAYSTYLWLAVTDESGRIVASTDAASVGKDRSKRPWFLAARDGLPLGVQTPRLSEDAGGVMTVAFTAPILGPGDKFLGAMTARVGLSVLEDLFSRTVRMFQTERRIAGEIEWAFLNRDGTILAESQPQGEAVPNLLDLGVRSARLSLDPAASPGHIEELLPRRQEPVVIGYAHTKGYGPFVSPLMGILVWEDRTAILAPINATVWKLGLAGTAAVLPMLGLLFWTTGRLRRAYGDLELRVQERTAELSQANAILLTQQDVTIDGILIVDAQGNITSYNQKFIDLWGIPGEIVESRSDERALRCVVDKVAKPEEFLARVHQLYAHPTEKSRDEIALRDGRTFDRYSAPMTGADGTYYGRIWYFRDITERKRAETLLLQTQEQLQLALKSGQVGLWTWNLKTNEVYLSTSWKAQIGYAEEELPNRFEEFETRLHPEDRDRVLRGVRTFIENPIVDYEEEFRLRHKDESYRWMFTRANVNKDADGRPAWCLGCNVDITERKRAERQVHQAKERFQSLVETVGDWIWEIDQKERYTYVSPRIQDLLGYEPADVIGKTPFELMPPDEAERMAAVFKSFRSAHAPFAGLENTNLHKDGRRIVLETSGMPVFDGNGQFLGYRGVDRDITERKRAEEALRRSEARQELTLHSLPIVLYTARPSGNYGGTWVSNNVERVTGFSPERFIEEPAMWVSRLHPDDREAAMNGSRLAVEQGASSVEYRWQCADGQYRWLLDRSVLIRDGEDKPKELLGIWLDITERKQMEEALRKSEELLRRVLEVLPVGVWIQDQAGRIVRGNPAVQQIWAGARYVGIEQFGEYKGWWADTGKRIEAEDWAAARAIRKGETSLNEEILIERFDGTKKTILNSALPIRDEEQRIVGAIIVNQDITERKRAEEELFRSREMLRRIIDNIPQQVFWKDLNLNYIGCNSLFAQSAGVGAPAAIVGKTDFDLSWKDKAETYRADDRSVMESKTPKLNFEEPLPRPDGSVLTIHTSKVPLIDQEGRVFGVLGIFADITERKRMELALQESEGRFRAIAESAHDAIVTIDNDGKVSLWNPAAERIFGLKPADVLGRDVHDCLAPERYRPDYERGFRQFRETGQGPVIGKTLELMARRADGTEFPVELSAAAVRLNDKWHAVGVIRDISQRKQMEVQARQLERLTALGQLLGGIAHELKNPLFILAGSLQIAREKLQKKEYDGLPVSCEKMQETVKRLTAVAEQFLHLASPVSVHQARCAVPALLQETLDLMRDELTKNRINVKVFYAPDLPETWLDSGQLREVFLSLIMNAVQAMAAAHGRGTLTVKAELSAVSAQPSASAERWIEVRIQDDGPGIPPAIRGQLFEPFVTTKASGQGAGLGLWIVRSNLMMLHGTVQVETEEGRGATFIVRLPMTADPSIHQSAVRKDPAIL